MKVANIPKDEGARLAALESLNIIYSPSEERFDRITRLAKRLFDVPIVLISLVSSEIQWFKSCQGLTASETPREVSFCAHALLIDMPLVIHDARIHPDFADNPLVTDEPYIRFYAGQTIKYMNKKIGTLCVIDTKPRDFTTADLDSLKSLASWVEIELENINYSDTVIKLLQSNSQKQRKQLIDSITGIWNQQAMKQILQKKYSGEDTERPQITVMKIGLDEENEDTEHSRALMDSLLKEVAQRIRSVLLGSDEIGHYGEKEFLVVLNSSDKATARTAAQNILRSICIEPFQVEDGLIMTTASIGLARSEDLPGGDWRDLIDMADSALYDAHMEGGNRSILASAET